MFFLSLLLNLTHAAEPNIALYADDKDQKIYNRGLSFAAVGNLCSFGAFGQGKACEKSEKILQHIKSNQPEFVTLLGNNVSNGKTKSWNKWIDKYSSIMKKKPAVPVVGPSEYSGDPKLTNWAKSFPEVGQDIGLNRVASWYAFDIKSKEAVWKMIVVDSNKSKLGSRWKEQLNWLTDSLKDKKFDHLIVMIDRAPDQLSDKTTEHPPSKVLLETIEENIGFMQLRAVLFSGVSQAVLPAGSLGPIHVGVGGGGKATENLLRWKGEGEAGLTLFTPLDLYFMRKINQAGVSPAVLAKAMPTDKKTAGYFTAKSFSLHGWWQVELDGKDMKLQFFHLDTSGKIEAAVKISYDKTNGWQKKP